MVFQELPLERKGREDVEVEQQSQTDFVTSLLHKCHGAPCGWNGVLGELEVCLDLLSEYFESRCKGAWGLGLS